MGLCFYARSFDLQLSAENLFPQQMLQSFNDAPHALRTQVDGGQRGNLLGRHPLPKVQPENGPITVLVRTCQATLQHVIDLLKEEVVVHAISAAIYLVPSFWIHIGDGDMRSVSA